MDLDDVTLELRARESVRVAVTEFPLLESDQERVTAARRLIRHAGNCCSIAGKVYLRIASSTSTFTRRTDERVLSPALTCIRGRC
jgi:hypothetical protein